MGTGAASLADLGHPFHLLQHYMSAEQIEQVLNLRGAVLKGTIEED